MDEGLKSEFEEDFALFIEAGFVAVKQLDEKSAKRLFGAAQVVSPQHLAPRIGLGYIALNKLEIKEATRIFEEVIGKEPENWLAQTFLGMCFLLKKSTRKKGEQLIEKAKEQTDDPTVQNLCTVSLQWADKDLKKMKAPFFSAED